MYIQHNIYVKMEQGLQHSYVAKLFEIIRKIKIKLKVENIKSKKKKNKILLF